MYRNSRSFIVTVYGPWPTSVCRWVLGVGHSTVGFGKQKNDVTVTKVVSVL